MTNERETREQILFNEEQRFRTLEGSGGELLDLALNGRPKNEQNVVNIWKLAYSAFSVWSKDAAHPSNRGANRHENFWIAVSDYLKSAGWTLKQLDALRFPSPLPGQPGFRSVLDEFREEGLLT
jgi:hypothetical protein